MKNRKYRVEGWRPTRLSWIVRGPDNRIVAREPTKKAAEGLRDYLNSPPIWSVSRRRDKLEKPCPTNSE